MRIVCYLRRQSDWVESWFNQIVKTDVSQTSRLSFEDFVARQERLGLMDYGSVLDEWATAFGSSHLVVRPWVRERLLNGNIVDDFCELVGLRDTEDLKRPEELQGSLSAPALEAMLSFNRQPTAAAHKQKFLAAFRDELAVARDRRFLMTEEQASIIDARHESGNCEVARRYCGADTLFEPQAAEARHAYAGLSTQDVMDVMTRLFIAQQQSMDALAARLDKLEGGARAAQR